jgi:hypothetical protein
MPYSKSKLVCLGALSVDALLDLAALTILILSYFLEWDMNLSVMIALVLNCAEVLVLVVGLIGTRWMAPDWSSIFLLALALLLTMVGDFLPIVALSTFLQIPWDWGFSLDLGLSSESTFEITFALSLAETIVLVIVLACIANVVRKEAKGDKPKSDESSAESDDEEHSGDDGTPENEDGSPQQEESHPPPVDDERTRLLPDGPPRPYHGELVERIRSNRSRSDTVVEPPPQVVESTSQTEEVLE